MKAAEKKAAAKRLSQARSGPLVERGSPSSKSPAVESRALAKGLLVIEALAQHRRPMTLPELSSVVELGKPSTLRLLQTLVVTGFAARLDTGAYVLNRRWVCSTTDAFLQSVSAAAAPEMAQLNRDLAETVSLAAAVDDHIRVIQVIESPRHIRMSNYRDRILPPYASSLGKAIAAYQTPERLDLLLRVYGVYPFTRNTITEPRRIREELIRVRKQGYAREYEETVEGGCCFGAPIKVGDEPVRAAISVSFPTSRVTGELEKSLPNLLKEAACRIAARLRPSVVEPSAKVQPGHGEPGRKQRFNFI